jgi:hypothetical protein
MPSPYDPEQHEIVAGLYRSDNLEPLGVLDATGPVINDAVVLAQAGTSNE